MKRIGTVTSAIGFIFIGIWMILRNVDKALAKQFFNWWPITIVLFGIEIIFFYGRKRGNEEIGFNFLIVPVFIAFLIINVFVRLGNDINFLNNGIKIDLKDFNIDSNDTKKIRCEKSLNAIGNSLNFNTRNGDINVKKSADGEIKFDLIVYVDKNKNINNYDLKENNLNEGLKVGINESYVRGVKGDIYVPDGYKVIMNINNIKLEGESNLSAVEWDIKGDNGTLTIPGGNSLILNMDNVKFDGKNIKTAKVRVDNGSVDFKGDLQQCNIQVGNGKVDIENKVCKDINVDVNMGVVEMKTSDSNMNVNLDVSQGKCSLNDDTRVNSGLIKPLGQGTGKLNMKVKSGTIKVSNQGW